MAERFGTRLREHREQQQIPLSLVAARTKISLSLLERLEKGDVSRWPSGIFRRSFIRDYAKAVGLDPEALVREFVELYPDPAAVPEAPVEEGPQNLGSYLASAIRSLAGTRRDGGRGGADVPGRAAAASVAEPLETPPESTTGMLVECADDAAALEFAEPAEAVEVPITRDSTEQSAAADELGELARICTELGQAADLIAAEPLLASSAAILRATGLIVWVWDPCANVLEPAIVHGYSTAVRTRLPRVRPDADNATAAAFRSAAPKVVSGNGSCHGAFTAPLLGRDACVGVLAVELPDGREQHAAVQAAASILAAQLATLARSAALAHAVNA